MQLKLNLFIVLTLSLLAIRPVYSQVKSAYSFGLTGGLNAGNIKNSFGYHNTLWRYNAGITLEKRFLANLAVACELVYSRQGNTIKVLGSSPEQVYSFDYIALPLMLRIRSKSESVFLELGPQLGYLLNNSIRFIGIPLSQGGGMYSHTNKLDVGMVGGLGYRFGKHFVVDGRYYYGMRSITADYTMIDPQTGKSLPGIRDKLYNRIFSFNLSYNFFNLVRTR